MAGKRLLSSDEVLELYGLKYRQLNRLVAEKRLRAVKIPGIRGKRYRPADLDALCGLEDESA